MRGWIYFLRWRFNSLWNSRWTFFWVTLQHLLQRTACRHCKLWKFALVHIVRGVYENAWNKKKSIFNEKTACFKTLCQQRRLCQKTWYDSLDDDSSQKWKTWGLLFVPCAYNCSLFRFVAYNDKKLCLKVADANQSALKWDEVNMEFNHSRKSIILLFYIF